MKWVETDSSDRLVMPASQGWHGFGGIVRGLGRAAASTLEGASVDKTRLTETTQPAMRYLENAVVRNSSRGQR
ncbi:hypothetical protein GGD41_002586 [Paraburkholderia bryophila]|uniref:Uncharacterized protein n=1 Tax=Paraburkholderia bryophila TaxID=420952 RepID=A0A7Y9W7U0_9BURK|nr:hypothetical protein [Paraburkholderia bryophila]